MVICNIVVKFLYRDGRLWSDIDRCAHILPVSTPVLAQSHCGHRKAGVQRRHQRSVQVGIPLQWCLNSLCKYLSLCFID